MRETRLAIEEELARRQRRAGWYALFGLMGVLAAGAGAAALRTGQLRRYRLPENMSLQAKGQRIASALHLIYDGPQMLGDVFLYHLFTDPETRTTFSARDMAQAKAQLMVKRQLFKMAPPDFPDIPDPGVVLETLRREVDRLLGDNAERGPHNPGGNPGHNPAVRFVGVGPPPPPPGVRPLEERRPEPYLPTGRRVAMVPPEERQRMLELRAEGLDYRAIADRMGRSISVVWRQINLPYEPRRRAITPQREQDALLMRRMGLSFKEIGQRMRVSDVMARYILHRAGERVDLIEAAQRLNERLRAAAEGLRPPATHDRLMGAAERVRRIGDDAALIGEITPEEVPRPLQDYPYEIGHLHSRALQAEEVLRNGAWCVWASTQEVLPPFPTPPLEEPGRPPLELPIRVTPAYREHLEACALASLDIARGVIQGWEGYEVKAEQTVRQIEALMALAAAEIREPREVPA